MPIEIPKDKWPGSIQVVTIGATPAEGGTRTQTITLGGETTLPFMHFEAPTPHAPVVAVATPWTILLNGPRRPRQPGLT